MLATMAPGLPFAISAQFAYPTRQCVAVVGDGGFAMLMAELSTAVQHNLPLVFYGESESEYGNPLAETTTSLRDKSYYTMSHLDDVYLGGVSIPASAICVPTSTPLT